jgi:hypothetical protein
MSTVRVCLTVAVVTTAALTVSACGGSSGGGRKSSSKLAPAVLPFERDGWKTDFRKHSVPLDQFKSGGPGRDQIPPLDHPKIHSIAQARNDRYDAGEPVIVVSIGRATRAYPEEILVWHEIVNDTLEGRPIAVTYCPLCNSALVYDRRVEDRTLRFGTTGNLRNSDLVMWDRQTQSWWQQIGGEAVVGDYTGKKLTAIPSEVLSWRDFKRRYPKGNVLSIDTGFNRPYGDNPYIEYETGKEPPIFFEGRADRRLPAKERVSAVTVKDRTVVIPFSRLSKERVLNTAVAGMPIVVFYKNGVKSALDARAIMESEDVGTATAFSRRLGRRKLEFRALGGGRFQDLQTQSVWDITGRVLSGPLAGRELGKLQHDEQFWFALAAFFPKARVLR